MQLPEVSIRRPVFATVLSLLLVLIGLVSFTRLQVREYPRIDEPTVTVSTRLVGASSEVIESQVTKPLEDSIAGIDGVDVITSISRQEQSQITVRFKLEKSPDDAAADVRDRVSRVRGRLPDSVDEPVISKVEADASPTIWLAFTTERLTPLQVTDLANRVVKPRLQTVPGVADVLIRGERVFAMRVWLDADKLAAYGVTVQDVEDALRRQNLEVPAGRIEGPQREFSVTAQTDLNTPEQFGAVALRQVNGYTVRLRDVARIEQAPASERSSTRLNGRASVSLGVIRQATANPLEVSAGVQQILPRLREELPDDVQIQLANDNSVFIDRSIKAVYSTILEAVVLVALVVFVFLRTLRASVIPLVTIPVSLIGAFALMALAGFTMNTLTLLALVLAIGLVVDDAIVVLENIYRHVEEGMTPFAAAIKGAREIGFAVVAMTLTLAAVYAPLAFTPGRTGRLFVEFALTLAGAVIVSGFVALTLSPMMCSKLLRHSPKHSGFDRWMGRQLDRLATGYESVLGWTLHHRWLIVIVMLVCGVASWLLFKGMKSELSPMEDRGVVLVNVNAPDGSTLAYTEKYMREIERVGLGFEEFDRVFVVAGNPTVSQGISFMRTVDWSERERSTMELAQALQPKLSALPGVNAFPITPPSLGQGFRERSVNFVIVTSDSYQNLAQVAQKFVDAMNRHGRFVQPDIDLRMNKPEIYIEVDRERAADAGVSVDQAHHRDDARRTQRDPLQARCRPVRRHRADRRQRAHHTGRHRAAVRAGPQRGDDPARVAGAGEGGRLASRAEPLQPAPFGFDHGQPGAGLFAGRGAGLPRRPGAGAASLGLRDRAQRRVA